ncbi:MAG TPA: sugar phosphate isomerase/epimerase [Thermoleophilaceae bacterium]|nr:sugar phosphate isomerase/epimerase [Thermoleophilaceae bacterium]
MALKVAMHNWMRAEPIETTIKRLGKSGYDGIEISGEPALYDADEVKRLLDEHDVACWGSVTLMTGGRDLVHEDHYVRFASIQYVKDCLSLVQSLGGDILTVVPSTVGKVTPMASPEEEWQWCVDGLKECQAHAEQVGVRIAVEPLNRFETYFINRADQAVAMAKEVGGNCGVALDIFHMNIEEADWRQAIRDTGDYLADFHVADNNRMPCGQGELDWEAIVQELTGIGYDGYLTVEFVVPVDRTPLSERTEIADASEGGGSQGMEKFLRDHGTGVLPESYYDQYVQDSVDRLHKAIETAQTPAA